MCLFNHNYEYVKEGPGGVSMDGISLGVSVYWLLYVCTRCGKDKWVAA